MIQHGYQNEVRAKKICSGEEKNENDERKRDGDIEDRGQIEIPGFPADVQDKNTGKQKKTIDSIRRAKKMVNLQFSPKNTIMFINIQLTPALIFNAIILNWSNRLGAISRPFQISLTLLEFSLGRERLCGDFTNVFEQP